jgi:hypothetical protein
VWGPRVDVDTARIHAALAKAMVDEGLGLVELGAARGRLEDVFAELTTATVEDAGPDATLTPESTS